MVFKPDIHLTYNTRIWNIFIAGDSWLLLELRDEHTLSASFDLYEISSRSYLWKNLVLPEPWRVGVSHCGKETIIFHRFESGTVPAVAELSGYDTKTGMEKWVRQGFQPRGFNQYEVRGVQDDREVFLNINTGEFSDEAGEYSDDNLIEEPIIPLNYTAESSNFESIRKFVKQQYQKEPVGLAEYLEYNRDIFLAFHIKEEDRYHVRLAALTAEGNIWLDLKVDEVEKFSSDIFFIWNRCLFFIEGKHQLKAIKLK